MRRIHHRLSFLGVVALLSLPAPLLAQVNVETLRIDPLRPGLGGSFDGNFALSRGNIQLLDVGSAARVEVQSHHPHSEDELPFVAQRGLLLANGRFAEKAGATFVNQRFAHARWTSMWLPRFGTDVFGQVQENQFLRLRARRVAGAGVRVELVHHALLLLAVGSDYMLEYERIDVLPGAPDRERTLSHRWSSFISAHLALFDARFFVQNTVYVQPRIDAFSDFRVLDELELLAKSTSVLALGMALGLFYDSKPPTGVLGADLRLMSTIKLSF